MSRRKGFNCMSHLEDLDQPIVREASQNFHAFASGIGIAIMTDPLSSSDSVSVTIQHVPLCHARYDDPQSATHISCTKALMCTLYIASGQYCSDSRLKISGYPNGWAKW